VGVDLCYFEALDFVEGDRGALVKVRWKLIVWQGGEAYHA
jgi:hypothetical protein